MGVQYELCLDPRGLAASGRDPGLTRVAATKIALMTIRKFFANTGSKDQMSGRGNCYNTVAVETFFEAIKAKLVWKSPVAFERKRAQTNIQVGPKAREVQTKATKATDTSPQPSNLIN